MDFYPTSYLNSTVEVFGEVRLFEDRLEDLHLESSHSLIVKLGKYQQHLEEEQGLPSRPPSGTNDKGLHFLVKNRLNQKIDDFKNRYKPAIRVHTIRHIAEAHEIIAENLRFRQLQNFRNNRMIFNWTQNLVFEAQSLNQFFIRIFFSFLSSTN